MISSITISVGVTLIALAGGMSLLSKTSRDNLGLLYKIAAWFIIVASVINLGCSGIQCMMSFYGEHMHYEMMMEKKADKKMHKHFMKQGMWEHHGNMGMHNKGESVCGGRGNCPDGSSGCNCGSDGCNCNNMPEENNWKKCCGQSKDSCNKNEGKLEQKK